MVSVDDYIEAGLVHSVHNSERMSFRGCRRRWDWIFRDGFYPRRGNAKPLEFGQAYHIGMQYYYKPETWELPRSLVIPRAIAKFGAECNKQLEDVLNETDSPQEQDALRQDYKDRVELGRGMLSYYFNSIAPKLDAFRPIKVEISFEVPITGPKGETLWCKCARCWDTFNHKVVLLKHWDTYEVAPLSRQYDGDGSFMGWDYDWVWKGLPVTFGGRIDAIVEDEFGQLWVVDWKSTARMADKTQFLDVDDQITGYLWALRVLGVRVAGFIYHEQRKGYPQPPRENKTIRLGCRYSVAKNQDTDYQTYLDHVKANDPKAFNAGNYDDFLDYLKAEGIVYSARYQKHKNQTELDNFGRYLFLEAREMTKDDVAVYPEPGRFHCQDCAFFSPCTSYNRGEDYQYTLNSLFEKKRPYWELR